MTALWAIVLCGALSIIYAIWATASVLKADAGNPRMQEIAAAVREGAQAYLRRQYTTIGLVGIVIFALLAYFLGPLVSVGFAIGAILSGAAGFIGMNVSVRANVRTAQAATTSLAGGLELAFKAGAITGLLVAGLALLGVTIYFAYLTHYMGLAPNSRTVVDAMVALGFGASLISIFARLGGGIFTKGADVGGDLVGKVEAGIPEDDPRNPATIADNVGDNVGDCAGMAADLFETYAVTAVATMVLAAIFFATSPLLVNMMTLPLAIGGVCIITSIIGTFFVKLGANQSIMGALYKGLIATGILSLVGVAGVIYWLIGFGPLAGVKFTGMALFECGVVGLVVTGLIIWITEYYTGTEYRPVKSIAAGFMGMMEGMSLAVFRDENLKAILADYAMEHFEIACYRSLRVAANEAGLPAVASPQRSYVEAIGHLGGGMVVDGVDDWRDALQKLAADAGLRADLGEKAARTVAEVYATPVVAHRYLDFLRELL